MKSRRILWLVAVAAALALWPAAAIAQEEKPEAKEGAQVMPMPKPSPELKKLDLFVGTWDEHYKFTPEMMPPDGGEGTGKSKFKWILDGWFLAGEMTSEPTEMGIYKSKFFMWYDQDKKVFRSCEFNNYGETSESQWTYDEGKKVWNITSDSPMMGQPAKHKSTMTMEGPNKIIWEWKVKIGDAEDYKVMMTGYSERVEE
jgi:hypothetical protein